MGDYGPTTVVSKQETDQVFRVLKLQKGNKVRIYSSLRRYSNLLLLVLFWLWCQKSNMVQRHIRSLHLSWLFFRPSKHGCSHFLRSVRPILSIVLHRSLHLVKALRTSTAGNSPNYVRWKSEETRPLQSFISNMEDHRCSLIVTGRKSIHRKLQSCTRRN